LDERPKAEALGYLDAIAKTTTAKSEDINVLDQPKILGMT
jgi:hypothetical protein